MEGILLAFRLERYDKNVASELVRRLYGQRTSSHGGKYTYWRRGLLDDIPYVRLIRGVIIVRTEDTEQVVDLLKGFGAEVNRRRVELTKDDQKALHVSSRPPEKSS